FIKKVVLRIMGVKKIFEYCGAVSFAFLMCLILLVEAIGLYFYLLGMWIYDSLNRAVDLSPVAVIFSPIAFFGAILFDLNLKTALGVALLAGLIVPFTAFAIQVVVAPIVAFVQIFIELRSEKRPEKGL